MKEELKTWDWKFVDEAMVKIVADVPGLRNQDWHAIRTSVRCAVDQAIDHYCGPLPPWGNYDAPSDAPKTPEEELIAATTPVKEGQ